MHAVDQQCAVIGFDMGGTSTGSPILYRMLVIPDSVLGINKLF
jgi:hypothetical protein